MPVLFLGDVASLANAGETSIWSPASSILEILMPQMGSRINAPHMLLLHWRGCLQWHLKIPTKVIMMNECMLQTVPQFRSLAVLYATKKYTGFDGLQSWCLVSTNTKTYCLFCSTFDLFGFDRQIYFCSMHTKNSIRVLCLVSFCYFLFVFPLR